MLQTETSGLFLLRTQVRQAVAPTCQLMNQLRRNHSSEIQLPRLHPQERDLAGLGEGQESALKKPLLTLASRPGNHLIHTGSNLGAALAQPTHYTDAKTEASGVTGWLSGSAMTQTLAPRLRRLPFC